MAIGQRLKVLAVLPAAFLAACPITAVKPLLHSSAAEARSEERIRYVVVISKIWIAGHKEFLSDGTTLVSNAYELTVVMPKDQAGVKIMAHCDCRPSADGRELAEGNCVVFMSRPLSSSSEVDLHNLSDVTVVNCETGTRNAPAAKAEGGGVEGSHEDTKARSGEPKTFPTTSRASRLRVIRTLPDALSAKRRHERPWCPSQWQPAPPAVTATAS